MKLSHVIEELVEERGLDRSVLSSIMCEGMLAAYKKKYPDLDLEVSYNKKNDEIEVAVQKTVVASPVDEDREISLRKARSMKEDAEIGDLLKVPFDGAIGRIEILKAKQIIAQKIRSIEYAHIYNEFKPKEGTIVVGVIHKSERNGITVKVQDTLAFLPKSFMLPDDKAIVGYSIRALLKEVYAEPRNENQLILDRTSPEFIKKLFELEIPEVFERIVEIKKIVRSPGYKSKVLVSSNDKNIDPVGTCIGMGGSRIKPILREIGSEKIDVIGMSSSVESFVKDALKPAVVDRVELIDNKNAQVWLDEDQRSLAIGRMGQNILLASQLTGLSIHLVKKEADASFHVDEEVRSDQEPVSLDE
ncbi:MAG: transcription termination factor NusA [Candidatus Dependentiae bacterium]|nr:transcription termination factor NusA [Candidatus Dependentiae bacterium]